ncbi:MAG TPA: hypothetical protein VK932_09620 [Kofleriaceae bacterium]|nr:hypothetical protein [Kofleriaceae bacterium]
MLRRCAVAIAVLFALRALAGCGNPGPGKPATAGPAAQPADAGVPDALPLDRDYDRLAVRAVALYEAVAEAFRAAGEDCERATARLGELAAAYRDVVAANAKILHEGRARELKRPLAKHGDRFDAAARAIMGSEAMARCAEDPAFTNAFDDLVGAPP